MQAYLPHTVGLHTDATGDAAVAEYGDFEDGHDVQDVHADSEAVGSDCVLLCQVFMSATHTLSEQASHV